MKELTGKGSPFHSALDKAASLLKRNVGTGMEFMQELGKIPGVKKEEIEDRKLHEVAGMPKMTREQFLSELQNRPVPAVKEKVLGEQLSPQELRKETNNFIRAQARRYASNNSDNSREYRVLAGDEMRRLRNNPEVPEYVANVVKQDDLPEHEKWTLPGGENYREILIKPPKGMEEFPGVEAHFRGEPNILASMRVKDRTGPNGEKLLHLEELQSDWHQQGREKGYSKPNPDRVLQINRRLRELAKSDQEDSPEWDQLTQEKNALTAPGVPDAPFKKNWEEMALKRLIHHAAEKGYHGIIVTPGAEQADRYSLAKHIDSIMLVPNPFPNKNLPYYFKAFDKKGNPVADDAVDEAKLQEYIGKEPAKQLLSSPANPMGERMVSGANIVTGDKAMKKFYDEKVPNILNSVGKKYGVKTQLHGHAIANPKAQRGMEDLQDVLRQRGISEDQYAALSRDQRLQLLDEAKNAPSKNMASLHYFPITEEMRKDVLQNGLPLYAEGGEVHMAKGGSTIKNIQDYIRQREGEYGLKRLQRAADEIPGLDKMYTEEALRRAFSGDNAQALMTMNPADFEKFARRLTHEDPLGKKMIEDNVKKLARIRGGFEDVPFLEINRRKPEYLPSIEGHEGRHRSRALEKRKIEKGLVQLFPNYGMREGMPRRYREDFIEAMKKELGEKRLVTPEGRSLLPADLTAMEHQNLERRGLLEANRPQLPEIYKDGGDVDPESCFFPKSKE